MKTRLIGMVVAATLITVEVASANTIITLDAFGAFAAPQPFAYLTGKVTVDVTVGSIVAVDLNVSGYPDFTSLVSFGSVQYNPPYSTFYIMSLFVTNENSDLLKLLFEPVSDTQPVSLVGFAGGKIWDGFILSADICYQSPCGVVGVLTPTSVVPLPATLPLFVTGLGALGLIGWRRKRKELL
jgi:PEP-CTERM motif-containing protein